MKYLKFIVGVLLVFFFLRNTNLTAVWELFKSADCILILLNLPVFVIGVAINSYKWNLLIPGYPYLTLFRSNLISAYYAVFLPGQLATEGVKAYRLYNNKENNLVMISSSIFVDKLLGLISLLLLGFVGTVVSTHASKLQFISWTFCACIVLILLLVFFSNQMFKLINFVLSLLDRINFGWIKSIHKFVDSCEQSLNIVVANGTKAIVEAILAGLCFQLVNVLGNYLVIRAIHIDLAFCDLLWIITLVSIALVLPITVAGLGLREFSFVSLFALLGYPNEQAIAFALAGYGMLVYHASFGYLVDLIWGVSNET